MLIQILNLVGKHLKDLPTIPKFMKFGKSIMCYNALLGGCVDQLCKYKEGHVPVNEIADKFANSVCKILQPGITWMMNNQLVHNLQRQKAQMWSMRT